MSAESNIKLPETEQLIVSTPPHLHGGGQHSQNNAPCHSRIGSSLSCGNLFLRPECSQNPDFLHGVLCRHRSPVGTHSRTSGLLERLQRRPHRNTFSHESQCGCSMVAMPDRSRDSNRPRKTVVRWNRIQSVQSDTCRPRCPAYRIPENNDHMEPAHTGEIHRRHCNMRHTSRNREVFT